ncbi:MAG: hypothetical protein KF778_00105 [Rhodocyclaceae bacterium]|nr:hypothetical protein [Rhodocyclaceae bacterium]MBX3666782.1 hypothetical protein [Rhodocyclaceae bacterium]
MSSKFAVAVLLGMLSAGCANLQQGENRAVSASEMERGMDAKLDQYCPIKDATVDDRLVRARLVLAAAAGYAYRSIQNYSTKTEIQEDAARSLNRLKPAFDAIEAAEKHKDDMLFPVYRADAVIELAEVAHAAVQPSLRTGRDLIGMINPDRLLRLRAALIGLLEDKLYLQAYAEACQSYASARDPVKARAAVNERIRFRCSSLAALAAAPAQAGNVCKDMN